MTARTPPTAQADIARRTTAGHITLDNEASAPGLASQVLGGFLPRSRSFAAGDTFLTEYPTPILICHARPRELEQGRRDAAGLGRHDLGDGRSGLKRPFVLRLT